MDKSILLHYTTIRKCFGCKEYVTLEKEYDEIIYDDKNYYHERCYKTKLLKRRINRVNDGEADELIAKMKKDQEEHLFRLIVKNHLYKYLMEHYGVVLLPNNFYTKMEQVFLGKFKNMVDPVPPEHILDMFQQKQAWLDRMYHKLPITGVNKINYDLAVLIARYPAYLEHTAKSNLQTKETQIHVEKTKGIDYAHLAQRAKQKQIVQTVDLFD